VSDIEEIRPGRIIAGKYEVEGQIGGGGFGTVYAASHRLTYQDVAIKVLSPQLGERATIRKRFIREARVTASLSHPNTVRVHDFGYEDGLYYLVMERLRGRTLGQLMGERASDGTTFSDGEVAELASGVLGSLAEAHAAGLTHRDLKPANIIMQEVVGERPIVKLLDFGIARIADSDLTGVGELICTPAFASPEVALGQPADTRSDLYSLGIILYAMVAGGVPFQGSTPMTTLSMHVRSPLPDLRAHPLGCQSSPQMIALIERATQKRAADRYAGAIEMRRALEPIATVATAATIRASGAPASMPIGAADPTAPASPSPAPVRAVADDTAPSVDSSDGLPVTYDVVPADMAETVKQGRRSASAEVRQVLSGTAHSAAPVPRPELPGPPLGAPPSGGEPLVPVASPQGSNTRTLLMVIAGLALGVAALLLAGYLS